MIIIFISLNALFFTPKYYQKTFFSSKSLNKYYQYLFSVYFHELNRFLIYCSKTHHFFDDLALLILNLWEIIFPIILYFPIHLLIYLNDLLLIFFHFWYNFLTIPSNLYYFIEIKILIYLFFKIVKVKAKQFSHRFLKEHQVVSADDG